MTIHNVHDEWLDFSLILPNSQDSSRALLYLFTWRSHHHGIQCLDIHGLRCHGVSSQKHLGRSRPFFTHFFLHPTNVITDRGSLG